VWGGPVDPFFRLPLWLKADCCGGHTLWAFNERHLDLLEGYVAAKLRERGLGPGGMTVVARLPTWLKSAKHRGEILRVIGRLRVSIYINGHHGLRSYTKPPSKPPLTSTDTSLNSASQDTRASAAGGVSRISPGRVGVEVCPDA
jgi:hypothetical protein